MRMTSEANNTFEYWTAPADASISEFRLWADTDLSSGSIPKTYEIDIYLNGVLQINGSQATITSSTYRDALFSFTEFNVSKGDRLQVQIKRATGSDEGEETTGVYIYNLR